MMVVPLMPIISWGSMPQINWQLILKTKIMDKTIQSRASEQYQLTIHGTMLQSHIIGLPEYGNLFLDGNLDKTLTITGQIWLEHRGMIVSNTLPLVRRLTQQVHQLLPGNAGGYFMV